MSHANNKSLASIPSVILLVLFATAPIPAGAWYYGGHHYGHGYHPYGGHHGRHYSYRGVTGYRSGGHGSSHLRGDAGCHSVSKTGYDDGRKAEIGGTRCYDEYGDAYIVPGSRYVVQYY
jgi:hypothetical protein